MDLTLLLATLSLKIKLWCEQGNRFHAGEGGGVPGVSNFLYNHYLEVVKFQGIPGPFSHWVDLLESACTYLIRTVESNILKISFILLRHHLQPFIKEDFLTILNPS